MQSRSRPVLLRGALGLATIAAACSPFTASSSGAKSDAGGAPGSDASDAGADAAVVQPNAPFCPKSPPPTLCADFTTDTVTSWSSSNANGGTITLDRTTFLSPPSSAHFTAPSIPAGRSGICVLSEQARSITAASVHVELGVRANAMGSNLQSSPKVLRIVFHDPSTGKDRYEQGLFYGNTGIQFVEQVRDMNEVELPAPQQPQAHAITTAPKVGEWHSIAVDVTLSGDERVAGSGSITFDERTVVPFTPPLGVQTFRLSPSFYVGLEYSELAQDELDYNIDDVVIAVKER